MKRPESHRIGELGEIRAMQLFTEAGWIARRLQPDYGMDLLVERTDDSGPTGEVAFVQVKATARDLLARAGVVRYRPDAKTRRCLSESRLPALLLVVDLAQSKEYVSTCLGKALPPIEQEGISLSEASGAGISRASGCVQEFWNWLLARSHTVDVGGAIGTTVVLPGWLLRRLGGASEPKPTRSAMRESAWATLSEAVGETLARKIWSRLA